MLKNDYGITKLYRISNILYKKNMEFFSKIIKLFIRIFFSATIPYKCQIGVGTKFPHGGQGVVLNEYAKIGKNCVISANVVVGGKKDKNNIPIINDNCIIGANSVIIGKVVIGENSIIGAGSVITKDVEPNSIVVGNPGRIIKKRGQNE